MLFFLQFDTCFGKKYNYHLLHEISEFKGVMNW